MGFHEGNRPFPFLRVHSGFFIGQFLICHRVPPFCNCSFPVKTAGPRQTVRRPCRSSFEISSGSSIGILPIKAGGADFVLSEADGFHQPCHAQIPQAVGADHSADFVYGMVGGNQLIRIGRVDSEVTGMGDRRRAHADMDLQGAGVLQHFYDLAAGSASDDGIVHHNDPLTLYVVLEYVQLQPYAELPHPLVGLDKSPARHIYS